MSRIVVVGGGLAGLSAAHRLIELSRQSGSAVEIELLESSSRLGGSVGTEEIDGFLVDMGADSFLTNKPGAVGLCRRLGIEDRLVATDERYRGALVLFDGRPCPVPDGFQLMSPTALWPMLTTPILSPWGKLRLAMELLVPSRQPSAGGGKDGQKQVPIIDESLMDFALRRFGRETFERLIQPLIGGIYTSDPARLSLAATLPRFLEMERDYGSLLRATLFSRPDASQREAAAKSKRSESSGARYGLFAGLAGGMADLLYALRSAVESSVRVFTRTPVIRVAKSEGIDAVGDTSSGLNGQNPSHRYRIDIAGEPSRYADAVIVTTAAHHASRIVEDLDPELALQLGGIQSASSALVVTGHRLADVAHPLNSFGLVIPHRERRKILAVSFSSRKFPDRAPSGCVLLRTFVGGALQPEQYELPEDEMQDVVEHELADIFGVRGTPLFSRIYRYPRAMPQYHVGHLDRIARIDSLVSQHPGLLLTGIAYRGVGVPDVIASSESTAEVVWQMLK